MINGNDALNQTIDQLTSLDMAPISLGQGVRIIGSGWLVYHRERREGDEPAGWHAFRPHWDEWGCRKPLRQWVEDQLHRQIHIDARPTRHARTLAAIEKILD